MRRSGTGDAYAAFPGVTWAQNAEELFALCQTVVLSVRPQDFPVPGFLARDHLLISFMAGWSLDQLHSLAPQARIFRAMPNGGATTGKSYTPWLAGPGTRPGDATLVAMILAAIGQEERLESEDQLHYLSGLSGSGGAYPGLMAKAMLAHAREFGLPDCIAERAIEALFAGSASLLVGKIDKVDELLESYMSYRGITAAGLTAAKKAGFETSVHEALSAAYSKAKTMGAD